MSLLHKAKIVALVKAQRQTGEQKRDRQMVIARITDTVILASSYPRAGAFEEQSNKNRFYPDGVYCRGDSHALLVN